MEQEELKNLNTWHTHLWNCGHVDDMSAPHAVHQTLGSAWEPAENQVLCSKYYEGDFRMSEVRSTYYEGDFRVSEVYALGMFCLIKKASVLTWAPVWWRRCRSRGTRGRARARRSAAPGARARRRRAAWAGGTRRAARPPCGRRTCTSDPTSWTTTGRK